jgi:hypothetical protein
MFHGNKKKEKTVLTEEENQKIEEKLQKIKSIQQAILERKKNNDFDEKNLDFLLKASVLMTDFSTIWGYRKEIIMEIRNKQDDEEFYKFIQKEIKEISPIMLKNPKSYVLWFHR